MSRRRPSARLGAGEAHAAHLASVIQQYGIGAGPGVQAHLVGLGNVLLVAGGAHVGIATAVHEVDVAGAQAAHLHGHVDGGVAGTDHQAAVGQGQLAQVIGLAQFADVCGGGEQAGGFFIRQAQLAHGIQAEAKEYRVVLVAQLAQAEVVAQALAMANFDATDAQQEFHFTLRIVVDQFVAGDAVLVEAASLVTGLEHHHVMPVHGQAMGTGQPCRPGTDHGDTLAGSR